ncbi:uncharacterized protein L3040_007081 [Drepanopeziza brunnea f. sp. 'multigermtubi']|uniref:AMP dependent CoA ligase n=1 Tax=Marssonina brunnea f. sp. multigermtubi (strain MB_m1) TaxID=1072389 RepID=K1WWE4_MARBU|nr:AMP dependent CoA ligase [Drepanopeziza brunnea f. sp. 'multigermtubi' MB_m1]EKD12998.1 AMP dependent CoA ligase [Drepanopeziza brunnea f. sp. 'multigermtubi' MB_m1]KAJ5038214.1 hypothetical protein L3040_007081 [Drepanopeziza brunnea f. sp. 'multigermtubi']
MQFSFPPISPFPELIELEHRNPEKLVLWDHSLGITATAGQLLYSIARFRERVQAAILQNDMYQGRAERDDRFIFLMAPPGWEYVVSMLTTFSLGAGISAQSVVIRPEDMKQLMKLADPLALLYAPALSGKIEAIKSVCAEDYSGLNPRLPYVEIQTDYPGGLGSNTYKTEPTTESTGSQTCSLFFTSGTTGKQKGVVHAYKALLASARERIETWTMSENDVILITKPGNWMGGIFGILPSLISGACLETCAGNFNPQWFWERIRQGGVSIFDIAPTGYDRLERYFDEKIAVLPPAEQEPYVQGMAAARVAGVTGSLLTTHTQKKWTEFRNGKPLLNLYGSTEVTLICNMRWDDPNYPDMCSVGPSVPGVEVKLVDGEMRLKAPTMFSRYISDDPTHYERAFDEEGFFKTGDCVEKVGNCYVLHGRANIDVLHFWGFTLHTGEIENALLSLPYIANAIVFPIHDPEYQERAAAVLQLKPAFPRPPPGLETLRRDLAEETGLFQFKQPTAVYWLQDGEAIPHTANGKVSKVEARERFYGGAGADWRWKRGVEVLDLNALEYWRMGGQC